MKKTKKKARKTKRRVRNWGLTTTNYTNYTNSSGAWYTLDGVKLDKMPTRKGVYIMNGRKVVIK